MILRRTKIQILAFITIAVLGVAYVGFKYVGLGQALFGGDYTVQAKFRDSGGIFSNAEVTYRGVQVGRVGPLTLEGDGVSVALEIDQDAPRIPTDVTATVSNRSAVGEQYVDLVPKTDRGSSYLEDGSVIPYADTAIPVPTEALVFDLDEFIKNIDTEKLSIVLDELDKAFSGKGTDLQRLLDAGDSLLATAKQYLPQTIDLIKDSNVALQTQIESGPSIQEWASNLQLLTAQLKASDKDIRTLLSNAPGASAQLQSFLETSGGPLAHLVDSLNVLAQVADRRLPGIEQLLITFPVVVTGTYTVVPGDGTAHFGLVLLKPDNPPPCTQGYEGTQKRYPQDVSNTEPNENAGCTVKGGASNVRGGQNAPTPSGPEPSPTIGNDAGSGEDGSGTPFPPGIGG